MGSTERGLSWLQFIVITGKKQVATTHEEKLVKKPRKEYL